MALIKRVYTDGETIITAQNLNDIQDEIISHANTFVPKTRTINSKALDANITLTASDLGAVPTTRTVNSKALSSNITLTAADVSAVPTTRTVNSKALSSNITLTSGDIGYNSSTTYTSGTVGKAVTDLNGALEDKILYYTDLQLTYTYPNSDVILRIPSTGVLDEITTDSVVLDCYFNRPDGIESAVTWQSYNGYIEFSGVNDASTNATVNVVIGKKKIV